MSGKSGRRSPAGRETVPIRKYRTTRPYALPVQPTARESRLVMIEYILSAINLVLSGTILALVLLQDLREHNQSHPGQGD